MSYDKVNEVRYEGKVFSVGNLNYTPQGNAVCNARMSVNRKFDDEWHSVWYSVAVWGDDAEVLARCNDKDEVIVTGRLDVSKPFTNKSGVHYEAGPAIFATKCERVGAFEPAGAASVTAADSDVPF